MGKMESSKTDRVCEEEMRTGKSNIQGLSMKLQSCFRKIQ